MSDAADTLHDEPSYLAVARAELGVHEAFGEKDSPRVIEYLESVLGAPADDVHGHESHIHDSTAWCSAFVNWCMVRAQLQGTHRLAARSWLHWGVATEPRLGAVTVLWRDDPKGLHGHVGFWVKEDAQHVYLLGGNQANSVCVRPYAKGRVLDYRWPS